MPVDLSLALSITSVADFLSLVLTDASDPSLPLASRPRLDLSMLAKTRHYYRGESNVLRSTALWPALVRDYNQPLYERYGLEYPADAAALLRKLVARFIRYAEEYRPDTTVIPHDYLSWMCIAQHHGLPTLLLDWSLNPLVSLFMACESNDDKLGVVYQMPLRPTKEREHLTVHLEREHFDNEGRVCVDSKGRARDYPGNNIRNHVILDTPVVIVPRILTSRIESQAGRFIYSERAAALNEIVPAVDATPWESIKPIAIVEGPAKERLRMELRVFRIHEGSMYADLDGYARFLRSGGL